MKKIIAIICGGDTSEHDVSMRSAAGIESFLDKNKYTVYKVEIHAGHWKALLPDGDCAVVDRNDFSFEVDGIRIRPHLCYITIHGVPGENGILQGYLELIGMPYTTSNVLIEAMTYDKFVFNNYMRSLGVSVADSLLVRRGHGADVTDEDIISRIGLPCFVKPASGGSSFGTSKVKTAPELRPAIDLAMKEGEDVMVEAFMDGTEISCGCYRTAKGTTVLPITEVVPQNEFFDYNAKYNGQVTEITPARLSQRVTQRVQTLTRTIYEMLGCRGIIRIDYIITAGDHIRMLEVNTTPGMTATSFIPQQVKAAGLNISDVMEEIIEDVYAEKAGTRTDGDRPSVQERKEEAAAADADPFAEIRPYNDDEIRPALDTLLADRQFSRLIKGFLPWLPVAVRNLVVRGAFVGVRSTLDFQLRFMKPVVNYVLRRCARRVSFSYDGIAPGAERYTFVSNHRDIVLDSAILDVMLYKHRFPTTCEIAIGDNLLIYPWIRTLVKMNKAFIVKRGLSPRELLRSSRLMSRYMHYAINEKKENIWIAQREGRAKDSNDRTQESLLKMMTLGGEGPVVERIRQLHIVPLTISYEYDPCDYLKAKEFQQKRDNPGFKKSKQDDLDNMKTGILGFKGDIHYYAAPCINEWIDELAGLPKGEFYAELAARMDRIIHQGYMLFPINYVAADLLAGRAAHAAMYTLEDRQRVEDYFRQRIAMVDLPDKDEAFLREKLLTMYANPVLNQEKAMQS